MDRFVTRGSSALTVLLLLAAAGCAPSPAPSPGTTAASAPSPPSVHVAFSGGGWRAHTAASGWTLALLDDGDETLADVFQHVGTVSSNSGGSWFSTMLVYSHSFVEAIEADDALETWAQAGPEATGWLGQQQYLFDQSGCDGLGVDEYLPCVFEEATGGYGTYWRQIVTDLVFKDHPIPGTLDGTRPPWAEDKPLLLAATMLTAEAVLGATDDSDKQYYQACVSPSTPVLDGDDGASCSAGGAAAAQVTPVTFSSLPTGTSWTAPPFFAALGPGRSGPRFEVGYTENAWLDPAEKTTTLGNPLPTGGVPVMTAAAASSAAGGFLASAAVAGQESSTGRWELAYAASDEALNFQLAGGVENIVADGMSVDQLAAAKVVQIADGGPVDNSGVAQLVSFLQQNDRGDGFHIVAFDNVADLYEPGGSAASIGPDLANLFGQGLWNGDQFCAGADGAAPCITVPDLQIFDTAPLTSPAGPTWRAAADDNAPPRVVHELIYTRYPVTTVDNPSFGITGGTTGTLHAFTCVWSDAETAPETGKFTAYGDMLAFIDAGLQEADATGHTGLGYLREALGLSP